MRQATCQLPYPFSRFSPPPRFDCSERSSPPPRSILENKGGNRQGECLSALQRLIKSSEERQRVNWQSRQDLADEKVAAVKREEQKKLHALRRCMRSEQIVRFKGSPFSKAGVDNSREGIVKEIVFTRPRHDTKMPDYIAVELLLRRRLLRRRRGGSRLHPLLGRSTESRYGVYAGRRLLHGRRHLLHGASRHPRRRRHQRRCG